MDKKLTNLSQPSIHLKTKMIINPKINQNNIDYQIERDIGGPQENLRVLINLLEILLDSP